jgi:sigma-B regulation protein RsbU (phosphoserine phosphatase)
MPRLTYRYLRARLATRGLWPRTRLARFTATLALVDFFIFVVAAVARNVGGARLAQYLGGWIGFLNVIVVAGLVMLAYRSVRARILWRLRNRLIVTYVFVGVIPVLLLVAMAGIAGYLLAGQFATFVATGDLRGEVARLEVANAAVTAELAAQLERGVPPAQTAATLREGAAHGGTLPPYLAFWYAGGGSTVQPSGSPPTTNPAWLSDGFHGAVTEADGSHWLRSVRRVRVRGQDLTVMASTRLDADLLRRLSSNLGVITLYTETNPANDAGNNPPAKKDRTNISLNAGKGAGWEVNGRTLGATSESRISGGTLPPPARRLDDELTFGTLFSVTHWPNGNSKELFLAVTTRPSLLYARLFLTLGEFSGLVFTFLIGVGLLFAVIELVALFVAVRLTRSITRSVHELYEATEHINRGDFRHRIRVRARDQLAALETSFNSMTESLERLLLEQKEKQRIENDLAIAQEVQEQLFPRHTRSLETLEVFGVCRPARTVSGDYYDFVPLGHEKLGIAVGDVSGKGISAALLMATIHSAVRAYSMGHAGDTLEVPLLAAVGAEGATGGGEVEAPGNGVTLAPAELLGLLNRQLYHSTPAEKYATLFVGSYDGLSRTLHYANGGHLPPIILCHDGSIRRLTVGGMVIGLFERVPFEQTAVELHRDDIFISFSDGITEPENEFGEFGEARLLDLVRENRHLPLERISEEVITAVRDWIGGAEQPDDITLVLARAR